MQTETCLPHLTSSKRAYESIKRKEAKHARQKEERREKFQAKMTSMTSNGRLAEDEVLLYEVDYFALRKNIFSTPHGKLKITDKTLICYYADWGFRIARGEIVDVKKKNYFFFIPSGIQIVVKGRKPRNYDFVIHPQERNEILTKLQQVQPPLGQL